MGEIRRDKGTGSIRERRDGRWEGRYRGKTLVTVATRGKAGRAECERRLAEAIRELGLGVSRSSTPLGEYLAAWLKAVRRELRPSTIERYEALIRLHIAPSRAGRIAVGRLLPADLDRLYDGLLERGVAPKTVELVHTVISGALSRAAERGDVFRNPAPLVHPPRIPRYEAKTLTAGELVRLFDAATGDRLEALWILAGQTGMRQGEILGLRWRDLDLEAGLLALRRGRAGETKTGVGRSIRLPARSVRALRAHAKRQELERRLARGAYDETELVFATVHGEPIYPPRLREAFARLLDRAGLPRIRFHDLRHTAATVLLESGIPAKVVAEILGHSSTRITLDVYSHVTPGMQEEAVAAMDRATG